MNHPPLAHHERLTLKNLSVFADVTFDFVPGINVLIGENGTGKTHVLKALYAWQMARHLAGTSQTVSVLQIYRETYNVKNIDGLKRVQSSAIFFSGVWGGETWDFNLGKDIEVAALPQPVTPRPVFIPAIEMMAHARNMNGILRDYADFDRTCFDFVSLVTAQPTIRRQENGDGRSVVDANRALQTLVPGIVEWSEEEQRFFLRESQKRLPFAVVAEGVRKVSALQRLIGLGWLAPGATLFWDEPEANINPRWMDEVIAVLISLAQSGVQIFLATHSYVVLKEINLALRALRPSGASPSVRYFVLHKERGASRVVAADDFAALEPNPILDQFDDMLRRDIYLHDQEAAAE